MFFKRIKDWATSITNFRTGDCIPVDGPSGTAKMNKDDLLALIGNSTEIYQRLKEAMLRSDEIAGGIKPRIFGTNWFDQSNMLAGKWVSYENGILNDHPDYSCSQLTPIEENTTYHAKNATNGSQIAFYDINLDFVGGALLYNQPDTEFQTPAGARFARYCTETANLTNFYVVKDPTIMRKDTYHFRGWYEGTEILVAKDGSGDFTTLTEAATYAVDGDVIHVKAGVYDNEAVQLFGKTVTVYGDGCLNTIIKNGWNTYSKAPIEMATGVLRDIQFYAFDGGSPSQDPSGATAYAIHVDSDTSYGKTFTVERCVFISEKGNSAVGVGIYGGCDFIFRDCIIVGGVSTPFFVHDSTNPQYVGVMELELYNNTFVSFGNGSFGIGTARLNGTTVYINACGNCFQDNGLGGLPHLFTDENPSGPATGNTNIDVVNWNIKPLNNGNNLPIFNGDYQSATKSADWIDRGTFDPARIPEGFVKHGSSQVGSVSTPVYVDSNGQVQPCDPVQNLPASVITSGTFGTDRIADDAITADKVKDNETLPVNVSGTAKHLDCYGTWDTWASDSYNSDTPYARIGELTFQLSGTKGAGQLLQFEKNNSDVVKLKLYFVTSGTTVTVANVHVIESTETLQYIKDNIKVTWFTFSSNGTNHCTIRLYVKFTNNWNVWRVRQLDCQTGEQGYTNWQAFTFFTGRGSDTASAVGTLATYIFNTPYASGQVGSTSNPVYVDSNGQVQPCDLAQLKAALEAL